MLLRRLVYRLYTRSMLREVRADALTHKALVLRRMHRGGYEHEMEVACQWVDDVNVEFVRRGLV